MGVVELIILIVLISTIGKVLSQRAPRVGPPPEPTRLPPGEAERIQETIDDLSERLSRLEEERDFYRDLLESPRRKRGLSGSQE